MANLVFIPNVSKSGSSQIDLADIPDEVKKEAEEVYSVLKTQPGRMAAKFSTLAELNTYIAQITAYCNQRPAELGGPIRFRKSPSRNLGPTEMQFRITDVPANEAVTEEIREAVTDVKTAAKSK